MKYIDAELLQKEIERQIMGIIKKQDANPDMPKYRWYLYEGMKEAFNDIGDFIDTLPDEPVTDCHDLEDEIKKFIEEYGYERGEDKLLIAIVARHFAQWGADHFRDTTKMIEPEKKEGEQ